MARLEELVRAAGGSTGAESDELVERYQQVATHLSVVRTSAPDARSSPTCPRCSPGPGSGSVGTRVAAWRAVAAFFTDQFPAALYRLRWWWLGTLAANVAGHRA